MCNFISEDDIEQAILSKLKAEPFEYDILICDADPSKRDDLNDGTGRNSKKECVLPDVMLSSLKRINPTIEEDKIKEIVKNLRRDYTGTDIVDTNYKLYRQIRNNIKITVRRNGREDFDFVKLIDFEHPKNNTFTAVSQMWIQGKVYYRRPDILIFVNGMPLMFIELKNSIVKVEEAYNKNLKDYMRDIPNLFAFNQICVLSNGLETKLGAFNATYDYFFEWLKVDSEKEKLDREAILAADNVKDSSVRYFVDGLLNKDRLIDYIENFILFENQRIKIIAKNHQYLGVNNLMESVKNRKELNGKLGVFWHTQGSGKSYSMVMFARNEDETRLLENASSRILEVIKRDGRLDKVAQDIAYHFPRRGFLGKGMVVSVDKYTAVKMYDKVQHYWAIEKQNIMKERNTASTKEERDQLTRILAYMNKVEMAVIISEENDEEAKFAKQGLKISEHRAKMKEITPDGRDIEDRFKDPNDSLQLVFVCAMWLTGFDVKNLSTLYLDKPMKGHTLMQAIARANRVYPGKPAGIIVDYVNVFKYMKKALTEYATGDDGTEFPAKDIDQLISYIDGTIDEADSFLLSLDIDLKKIIADSNTLDKLDALRSAYDTIVAKDGDKEKFKVILNTLTNLYEASKPEIFEKNWSNEKFAPLVYLHGLFYHTIDDEKVARARQKMNQILDGSVTASQDFVSYVRKEPAQHMIKGTKAIDLSKVDVEQLRKEIKVATYKAIEINDLKEYIEQALEQMLNRNCTRTKFSERFKRIIDSYNAGGTENEDYYKATDHLQCGFRDQYGCSL